MNIRWRSLVVLPVSVMVLTVSLSYPQTNTTSQSAAGETAGSGSGKTETAQTKTVTKFMVGTVLQTDASRRMISVKQSDKVYAVYIMPVTALSAHGATIAFSDIEKGDEVFIEYMERKNLSREAVSLNNKSKTAGANAAKMPEENQAARQAEPVKTAGAVVAAPAKTDGPEPEKSRANGVSKFMSGMIAAVDTTKMTISVELKGKVYPLFISPKTEITGKNGALAVHNLQKGDRVSVEYIRFSNGDREAEKITAPSRASKAGANKQETIKTEAAVPAAAPPKASNAQAESFSKKEAAVKETRQVDDSRSHAAARNNPFADAQKNSAPAALEKQAQIQSSPFNSIRPLDDSQKSQDNNVLKLKMQEQAQKEEQGEKSTAVADDKQATQNPDRPEKNSIAESSVKFNPFTGAPVLPKAQPKSSEPPAAKTQPEWLQRKVERTSSPAEMEPDSAAVLK